jgi:hypothetical protein
MNARVGTDTTAWPGLIGGYGCPLSPGPPQPLTSHTSPPSSITPRPCPRSVATDNGRRCLEMCHAHNLCVTNTFFQHRDKHCATWRHADGRHWAALDLILVNQRFRHSVQDCKVIPDAVSHFSDHSIVVCDLRIRLRADFGRQCPHVHRRDDKLLLTPITQLTPTQRQVVEEYHKAVTTAFRDHTAADNTPDDAEAQCQAFHDCFTAAAQLLPPRPLPPKKPWITEATLHLLTKRRSSLQAWHAARSAPSPCPALLQVTHALYLRDNKACKYSLTSDHNAWLNRQATVMQEQLQSGQPAQAWASLRTLTGKQRPGPIASIRVEGGFAHGAEAATPIAHCLQARHNVPTSVSPDRRAAIPPLPPSPPASLPCPVASAACALPPPRPPNLTSLTHTIPGISNA